ncbi:unnamed protein product, partial [Iphiclides podalirius]
MRVILSLFPAIFGWSRVIGTIDMSARVFEYIVDQLTAYECRKLVASLYFVSDDLPSVLAEAEERIPSSISCYDLLISWNGGREKWQGRGKSHGIVARRLRQLGKSELARRLSVMVFHNLAEDINKTLLNYAFDDNGSNKAGRRRKLLKNKHVSAYKHCEVYDSVLWAALLSMSGLVLFSCCRVIYLACKNLKIGKVSDEEELNYLLKDRLVTDDQDS